MVSVKKIMSTNLKKASDTITAKEAAKLMKENRIGCILIEIGGEIIGVITEADMVRKVVAEGLNPDTVQARTIMSSPLLTIDAEKTILDANDMMDKHVTRHLGVTEEGKIIGVVSSRDIMHPQYMEGEEW
jgi:signal-transduction protein with cAMP-binding, CBS, and nucleotidyltransferase domain